MTVDFFMPCEPPTASHHAKKIIRLRTRNGGDFVKLGDKPELQAAKKLLETLMLRHRIAQPITGPVTLTLEFTWSWRASDSQKARAAGRLPKFTRPDCSNLAKTTEDRLVVMGFLEDDGQVVELIVRKWVGDRPGIRVVIAPFFESSLPLEPRASA
jgi:Holliday junction resolvase RusA-like endonuclease